MFRLALLLIVVFALIPRAQAVQLGDSREQIVAQYGPPAAGTLDADRGMGTYRWNGWRLDVEVMQSVAQRLIFTKDAVPLTEAEQRQLLNDNGGIAVWQPVDHVTVGALADKKWRRMMDGAEAFTITNDGRKMCLVTRFGADAWARAQTPATQPTSTSRSTAARPNKSNDAPPPSSPPTATGPLPGLIGFVIFAGFIGFVGRAITRSLRKKQHGSSRLSYPLWSPPGGPRNFRNACTIATPPPRLPVPAAAARFPNQRTLEDLSWQVFELLVGELYRRQGYAVEMCSGDGSDGGVDLWLRRDGRTTLVQCKHWKVYKVGVSPVRELFGILSAEKADHAILVTTGKFTQDAKAFAAGKPLELIAGDQLRVAIEASKYSAEGDLLDVARWSSTFARTATITTPMCPFCRSFMVLRRGKQSRNQFWGCSTYPGCRGKRNVRPELMRA